MVELNFIDFELTERCNNNCIHCYINRSSQNFLIKNKELRFKQIISILDDLHSNGIKKIRFTGGEPLLRDDFFDIYLYAYNLGFKIYVSTNATLFTAKHLELLRNQPPQLISTTIYGWDKYSYEKVTSTTAKVLILPASFCDATYKLYDFLTDST